MRSQAHGRVALVAVLGWVGLLTGCVSPVIRLTEAVQGCYLIETRIDSVGRRRLARSDRPAHGPLAAAPEARPSWREVLALDIAVAPRSPMGADRADVHVATFASDRPRHPEDSVWWVEGDTIRISRGGDLFTATEYWVLLAGDSLAGRGAELTDAMTYSGFSVHGRRSACVTPNGRTI